MGNVVNRSTLRLLKSAHTPDFDPTDWLIEPPGLEALLAGAVPSKHWKLVGDDLEEMSTAEKEAVELPLAKAKKLTAIDTNTGALIAAGFAFGGKMFSLSINAQAKLMGVHQVRDDAALEYPIRWNTIDDADALELDDAAEVHAFYLTAVGTYRVHVDGGTALKDAVRAATTVAAVDAIEDTR